MRELTVILSDIYGPAEPSRGMTPALADLSRYGKERPLSDGWRSWVARHVGRADLATVATAVVAAQGLADRKRSGRRETPVWLATPVHLQAAINHVRLPPWGVLSLRVAEVTELAADFARSFLGSGLELHPLGGEGWLLTGLASEPIETVDPARALGADIAAFVPQGAQARPLRALAAQIEMWLHDHAVNRVRAERREPPLSSLWLWGGGVGSVEPRQQPLPRGFAEDPYLGGLWQASGSGLEASRAALAWTGAGGLAGGVDAALVEFRLFRADGPFADLPEFDSRWLGPCIEGLRRGRLQRLTVATGDRLYRLARPDLWKFWRRARPALGAGA